MCHMRKGFANSTSSRLNADASELTSSWSSKFSKEKLTLTRLNSSSVHRPGLRGHTYRLLQRPSRLRRRSGAFSARIVKFWNRLPTHLVLAPSVSMVKKQLDSHWFEIFPAPVYNFCPHSMTIFSILFAQTIYVFS